MLRESGAAGHEEANDGSPEEDSSDGWDGFPDQPNLELVDHEEEYIDEDRYTTVTVETVNVSRDGLEKPNLAEDDEVEGNQKADEATITSSSKAPPKKKKPKFRYEHKLERQIADKKQKARHRAKR
jgi:ribosomal RNA-processing protein 17